MSSWWFIVQLERLKIRKKSPHGGPYYYTVLQPDLSNETLAVNGTADPVEDPTFQVPEENCDITETVEMVYTAPSLNFLFLSLKFDCFY